jgi:glutamyl-tRNA reductase
VISSTSAPGYVLDRLKIEPFLKGRRSKPLLLIDIAVPRDIDPEVNMLSNVYLYNIDDLQSIADDYLKQRQQEIVHCEKIIREKAEPLLQSSSTPAGGIQPAYGHE